MATNILKTIRTPLLLFLAALFGYFFNYVGDVRKNSIRYLDLKYEKILSVLSTKVISDKKLKILWENEKTPIKSLGVNNVKLFNFSDKDFEDIIVRVKVTSSEGGSPDVLYSDYFDKDGLSKSIIEETPVKEKDGSIIYEYKVPIINRNYDLAPVFTARYFFKNNNRLTTVAIIQKKGVEKRNFSLKNFDRRSVFEKYGAIMVAVVISCLYFAAIIMAFRSGKKKELPAIKNNIEIIIRKLKDLDVTKDENDLTKISTEILFALRLNRWKKEPTIFRRLISKKKPSIEDIEKALLHNNTNSANAKKQRS